MIRNASQKFSCSILFFYYSIVVVVAYNCFNYHCYLYVYIFFSYIFFREFVPRATYTLWVHKIEIMKLHNGVAFLNIVIAIKYLHCLNSWLLANTSPLKRYIVLYDLNIIKAELLKR